MAAAVAASDSSARSASTLRISGCSASSLPKALRWRAWCTAWARPQRIEAAEPIRQSRRVWLTMRMIVRHAAALLADQAAAHAVELDLARGQRAGAELVLQALDAEAGVARLEQEAGQPGGRLGEREEDVAGRIGAEPLVAGDLVLAVAGRLGAGGVGAHVGAALLLGHRHAGQRAVGVGRPGQARLPLGGQLGRSRAAPGSRSRSSTPGTSRRRSPGSRRTTARRARRARPAGGRARAGSGSRARSPGAGSQCQEGSSSTWSIAVAVAVVGAQHAARCARRARSARAPRGCRPARRCRAGGPRPSRRPRARAPRAAAGRPRRRCTARAAAPGWLRHAWTRS